MANYATLKAAIQQVVKTNGNNEITGALLQQSLLAMINSLGDGYQFIGVATPTTNPGTPDQKVFYIASIPGTYSNFGGIVVGDGLAILKFNNSWQSEIIDVAKLSNLGITNDLGGNYEVSDANQNLLSSAQGETYKLRGRVYIEVIENTVNAQLLLYSYFDENGVSQTGVLPFANLSAGSIYEMFNNENYMLRNVYFRYNSITTAGRFIARFYGNVGGELLKKIITLDASVNVKEDKTVVAQLKYDLSNKTDITNEPTSTITNAIVNSYGVVAAQNGWTMRIFYCAEASEFEYNTIGNNNYVAVFNTLPVIGSTGTIIARGESGLSGKFSVDAGKYVGISYVNNTYLTKLRKITLFDPDSSATKAELLELQNGVTNEFGHLDFTSWSSSGAAGAIACDLQGKVILTVKNITNQKQTGIWVACCDSTKTIIRYIYEFSNSIGFELNANQSQSVICDFPEGTKYIAFGKTSATINAFVEYKIKGSIAILNGGYDNVTFNNVARNQKGIANLLYMLKYAVGNHENRILVSFNGDSIIGQQLDGLTPSPEINTGAFPPNMSKMIMARQFYDKYKLANEDTQFRNLIHSDWVKTGFNIATGSNTFNHIETYGCANGDSAQITITGYKYVKLVWSEYRQSVYSFEVYRSTDGGDFELIDTITTTSGRSLMTAYKIYTQSTSNTYVYKIVPISNFANVCFWGCEFWNNVRLDVVVEAYSGSTARLNKSARLIDGWYSENHKPIAIIADILCLNDGSEINNGNYTYEDWIADNRYLVDYVQSKGVGLILFGTHSRTATLKTTILADYLLRQNNVAFIDIHKKEYSRGLNNNVSSLVLSDGVHLNDAGQNFYFEELARIFDNPIIL